MTISQGTRPRLYWQVVSLIKHANMDVPLVSIHWKWEVQKDEYSPVWWLVSIYAFQRQNCMLGERLHAWLLEFLHLEETSALLSCAMKMTCGITKSTLEILIIL